MRRKEGDNKNLMTKSEEKRKSVSGKKKTRKRNHCNNRQQPLHNFQ